MRLTSAWTSSRTLNTSTCRDADRLRYLRADAQGHRHEQKWYKNGAALSGKGFALLCHKFADVNPFDVNRIEPHRDATCAAHKH